LVSCKDLAKTGASVSERDLPSIRDKLEQHGADGFLLATTTTASTAAKALLDGLHKSGRGSPYIHVWDQTELEALLLDERHHAILQQFLPESYRRVKGLTTMEGALLEFRDQLPDTVMSQVMTLIRPFSQDPLSGSTVWPYDPEMAAKLDDVVTLLLTKGVDEAVQVTAGLSLDAFMALAKSLQEQSQDQFSGYLYTVVTSHPSPDFRLNAFQLLTESYELSPEENIELACSLDSFGILEIFGDDVQAHIESELVGNTTAYDCYATLDLLASRMEVDTVTVESLQFHANPPNCVRFKGDLIFEVNLFYGREPSGGMSFSGEVSGYFDTTGMFIDEATVDTAPFYE